MKRLNKYVNSWEVFCLRNPESFDDRFESNLMYYGDYFDYDWMTYVGGSPKSGIVAKVMKIMPRMYGNEDHKIALYFPKN